MYNLDDTQFPILIQTMDAIDTASVESMKAYEQKLTNALDRGQLFGIMALITADEDFKAPKDLTKYSNDMFKRLKPRLAQTCVGYAAVTQVGKWLKIYKPIANVVARNRMGCDGAVFEHETQARAWLNERLRERGASAA